MNYKKIAKTKWWVLQFVLFFGMCFTGCNCNKEHVDVSGIDIKLNLLRFDQDLFKIDSANYKLQVNSILETYRDFFPFYCQEITSIGVHPDTTKQFRDSILAFTGDKYIRVLHDSAEILYSDFSKESADITTAFKYIEHYFPKAKLPSNLITYIAGISYPAITYGDSDMAIGIDMYLGSSFSVYSKVRDLPRYQYRKFTRDYITPNAVTLLLKKLFPFNGDGSKLIENMVYQGKLIYVMGKILPDTPDSVVSGFPQKELDWFKVSEGEFWKFLVANNLLYSTDENNFTQYVTDGPFTPDNGDTPPANTGSWVGWQIVKKYMDRHPDMTLVQLMAEKDAAKILNESHYKP